MRARALTAKPEILRFLQADQLYAAYAIGDLEPDLYAQAEWVGAEDERGLRTLVLYFKGLEPPALFLMGDRAGLPAILGLGLRPRRVYVTCRGSHLSAVQAFYQTEAPIPMWRMALRGVSFRPVGLRLPRRLSPRHAAELERLYALGGGLAFNPTQLATGVFYGVVERGRVVAAAGTHLVSPTYKLAAVGNVFTDPAHRGRGYATASTSAVVRELFQRGMRYVILNVAQSNHGAIRIYERLGFAKYCPFLEMLAVRQR